MRSGSTTAWLLLCVGAWLVAGLAAFAIAEAVEALTADDPGSFEGHRLGLTVWMGAWAPVAGAIIIGIAGAARAWTVAAWVLAGSATAALVEFTLLLWGEARFGDQGADPDLLGPTAFLSVIVVASTVTVVARSTAPSRNASALATIVGIVILAGGLLVGVSNAPGLADGVGPAGLPLALAIGVAECYCILAALRPPSARAVSEATTPVS